MYARQEVGVLLGAYDNEGAGVLLDTQLPRPCTFKSMEYLDDALPPRQTIIAAASKIIGFEVGTDIQKVAKEMLDASLPSESQFQQLALHRKGRLLVSLFLKRSPGNILARTDKSDKGHIRMARADDAVFESCNSNEAEMARACSSAGSKLTRELHSLERLSRAGMLACALPLLAAAALPIADQIPSPALRNRAYEAVINLSFAGIASALAGVFVVSRLRTKRSDPRTHAEVRFIPSAD